MEKVSVAAFILMPNSHICYFDTFNILSRLFKFSLHCIYINDPPTAITIADLVVVFLTSECHKMYYFVSLQKYLKGLKKLWFE